MKNVIKSNKDIFYIQQLVRNMSHDVRNAFSIIRLTIELSENLDSHETDDCLTIRNIIQLACFEIDNSVLMMKVLFNNEDYFDDFEFFSILEDVNSVLRVYPISSAEKKLIIFKKKHDFMYFGSRSLTKCMIFNLLKNSLSAISRSNKGKITIELTNNRFVIIDTGCGVNRDILNQSLLGIEDRKDDYCSGLGLLLCSVVMMAYKGKINCESDINKYTQITLAFPNNNHN